MPRIVPSQVVNLIDQLFPQYSTGGNDRNQWFSQLIDRCYGLQAILVLFEQIPPSLLVLNNQEYSELVSGVAAISNSMKNPKSHGHGFSIELSPISEFGNLNPIALIRDLLAKCPDEFPSPGTAELLFMADHDLRAILRNDIDAVNRALADSEWKAATVLAGSVVEALLLWALQQRMRQEIDVAIQKLMSQKILSRSPSSDLELWTPHDYIEVSSCMGLISAETTNQTRLAKNFRNLIHPGRSQRLGQACNRATALSAVAAVEHVVQDLTH